MRTQFSLDVPDLDSEDDGGVHEVTLGYTLEDPEWVDLKVQVYGRSSTTCQISVDDLLKAADMIRLNMKETEE